MNETKCRTIVSARSGGMCERCGNARAHEKHHRVNRSAGGTWTPENIGDLCPGCHQWITTHPTEAAAEGWHLRDGEDPAAVSVVHAMLPGFRMFLTADGGLITDPDERAPETAPIMLLPYQIAARERRLADRAAGIEPTPERLRDVDAIDEGWHGRDLDGEYIAAHYVPEPRAW